MNFVLYILGRLIFRFLEFWRRWYLDSFRTIGHLLMRGFKRLDRTFALKITLTHIFEPLYGDYSFIGRVFGFLFRLIRVVIAILIYGAIILAAAIVYLLWAAVPPYIILRIIA